MAVNLSGSPYWDRYWGDSAHRSANYTKVLAKPGYAEQASEFNEIQSIQRDYTERLGSSIYKEGAVLSGCAVNISNNIVTISSGVIFVEKLPRNVSETVLTISGIGTERIVASINPTIVTANTDSSLRDPSQGSENYGQDGADRLREDVVFSVITGDSESGNYTEIFHLEDGEIINESRTDTYAIMDDILAQRTFDENGNYKVRGLNISTTGEMYSGNVRVQVSDGKAYVQGYEVLKTYDTNVDLNQSLTTRRILNESHYYDGNSFKTTNYPISEVVNFNCQVGVTREAVSRGATRGGRDVLKKTPVDHIVRVYTLDSNNNITHTYRELIDYRLYDDQVDWSLTGDNALEPDPRTTYYVDYVYNKAMVEGTDFEFENTNTASYVRFLSGGSVPGFNTRMNITYNFTLARRDLLLLDRYGEVSVIEGVPDKLNSLVTPYNGSDNFLELGYVDIMPTDSVSGEVLGNLVDVVNYESVRLTQQNFYTMLQRIDLLELDMADLDLERSSIEGEDTSSLNGYFVDSFQNINKSDLGYNETVNGTNIAYTACIDYDTQELTTVANMTNTELTIDNGSSDDYASYGRIISAPYVYEREVYQPYVTGTMLVNPYASYGPMCQILIDPEIDNWIDENKIVINNTVNKTSYTTTTNTYSHGWWSVKATKNLRNYLRTETTTTVTKTGTTKSSAVSEAVAKSMIEYMRVREIKVKGRAFSGNMRNIYGTFAGIPVNLVATGTTVQGNSVNVEGKTVTTVNADANGSFNAKFTIPSNVKCGSVEFRCTGKNDINETYSGAAVYKATGTLLTTTITNTTTITQHYKVLNEVHNLYASDPLAQSFVMNDTYDRSLMKIGMYFATKSTTRPAIVQVRNIVNGYPGEEVYAEVTLEPSQVNIPTNPLVPVVTEVVLNQPVYCKAHTYYCFVVLSDSNAYSMYYANMGDNLLGRTDEQMIINPYATGVLFSSSNSTTWTAHQGADLKFELYRSRFTGSGEIIFDEFTDSNENTTGLLLDAAFQDDDNNGLDWYYRYKLDNGSSESMSDWLPIDTLVYRGLNTETNGLELKVKINTNYSTSPYIDSGRVSLKSFVDETSGTYISHHLDSSDFEDKYQALKIMYQAAMPMGADHTVYYLDINNDEWIKLEEGTNVTCTTKQVDEEFVQYTWDISPIDLIANNPSIEGADFFKLRIDLSTTTRYNRPRIRRLACIFKYL